MIGTPGLRGQSLAGPLLAPGRSLSAAPMSLLGLRPQAGAIELTKTPANLDAASTGSPIITPTVTVSPRSKRRGEAFRYRWMQSSGAPGEALSPADGATAFRFSINSYGAYPQAWRCRVENQYGEFGEIDLAFTVTRYDPGPPQLYGAGSPSGQQLVAINPSTRQATVYFSANASGGVPPYTFNWGGGDYPTSASNQVTFYLPPGAVEGITFDPGCTITDSYAQSIVVGAGPFFIYEG